MNNPDDLIYIYSYIALVGFVLWIVTGTPTRSNLKSFAAGAICLGLGCAACYWVYWLIDTHFPRF